jgi:hypothetical protein
MHLLSGTPVIEERLIAGTSFPPQSGDITLGEIAAIKANVSKLEAEVGELKALVVKLCTELGVSKT